MPKHLKTGIDRCFFLPIREKGAKGEDITKFELFLLVGGENCLAFRFEPAHPPPTTHGYGHVQMCREMVKKTVVASGIPPWLPIRYPAIPTFTSEPLRMFLSMATAVHGYVGGILTVLQDVFQTSNRSGEVGVYFDELKKMLN
jgi:hypothetical protein